MERSFISTVRNSTFSAGIPCTHTRLVLISSCHINSRPGDVIFQAFSILSHGSGNRQFPFANGKRPFQHGTVFGVRSGLNNDFGPIRDHYVIVSTFYLRTRNHTFDCNM